MKPHFLEDFALTADPRWCLEYEGFDPALVPTLEAVFALVNGALGSRAALEEGSTVSRAATFLAGIFNTPAHPQTPDLPEPIPELVVAPDWSGFRIMVEGQELRLTPATDGPAQQVAELLEQRRVLDMRQGVLLRNWRVRDAEGRITRLQSLRFASLADRHTLVQVLAITPENYSGRISLESMIDGQVTNENAVRHLEPLDARRLVWGTLLTMRTTASGYTLAFAGSAALLDSAGSAFAPSVELDPALITTRWEWEARQGESCEMHKVVAVFTSRGGSDPAQAAAQHLPTLLERGTATLCAEHIAAWAARWDRSDVVIAGDAALQRQVRFALYHLIGAANPDDVRSSVGARALTGERYRGHVFWDTETFVWPYYLFTHPQTARALLLYRYHTLDGARRKAQAMGYRGALYAWESTDSGAETTPPFVRNPAGELLPILTGIEEHHISADIAYAVDQYLTATGDSAFYLNHGAEMLLEIARFWASRAEPDADGRYHIRKVIGPDEYHESVDNNAYTNVMAQWCLQRGLACAADLAHAHTDAWDALAQRLALRAEELELWQRVAAGLVTGFDPQTGLYEQFAGYYALRPFDLRDHDSAVATMDVRLGWHALQQTQVLKQADVVMLLFLLWDTFPPALREANFRYYEPRTAHDSSLSPSFHALVAARLNDLPMALRYLRQAARIDLDFTREGWAGATGGVHIAALGGIWQALAFGFLGMRPQPDGLRFEPHIPASWGSLSLPLQWRGRHLHVSATADPPILIVNLEAGEALQIARGDAPWQNIEAGRRVQL